MSRHPVSRTPVQGRDPVLIVGAGPTGLVLALWLTKLGMPARIIDKTAEPGTTSRALAIQARTLEFYSQIGLADAVVGAGIRIESLNFWVSGVRAAHVRLGQFGEELSPFPFALVYPQDAHERLLIDRLSEWGVRVERRTELLGFEQHDAGVRARLLLPDGSEESCEAIYLAGCDGASSTVREGLGVGFPGGTYTGQFFVADVDAAGPAVNDELHVDLEDADFVLVFPLRPKGRLRLVGIVRDRAGSEHDTLSFEDVKGRAIERLKLTVERVNWFSTYRVHHRVANQFRVGRAFLLGDAAHIHSPVGGQGMNTGIGDAVNLAWKLAAVLSGRAGENLLETYERERIVFAHQLVATTDRAFTVVTARGGFARFIRTRVVPRFAPMLLRLRPVRRFLFETVSQIEIAYPHSWLSAEAAGKVRGGDRLPWVKTGTGKNNFTALQTLDWQAHMYGEASPDLADACARLRLPLHVFAWQAGMRRAGLKRGALYLVRPDGYVALADAEARAERLLRFFAERGLHAGRHGGPP